MKVQYLYLILILLMGVMLAGCKGGDSSTASTRMFAGGTSGLVLGFLEGSPPAEVFDANQYPFDVEVKVENAGEWDVQANEVTVSLSGIDPTEFGATGDSFTKHPEEDLPGVGLDSQGNAIPGQITYVSFAGLSKLGEVTGRVTFPIRADVCYTYGTTAQAKICMKEDMLNEDSSICSANEIKSVENSGAPIQVVSLNEEPMGSDKLSFTFKIQHRGTGAIAKPTSSCSTDLGFEDELWVDVEVPGTPELSCAGLKDGTDATNGYVKLNNGYRIITCKMPVTTNIDFEKIATIVLKYDYKEHVDTTLMVKHAG